MQRDDFNVCCLPESGRFAVHGMNSTISLEVAFVCFFGCFFWIFACGQFAFEINHRNTYHPVIQGCHILEKSWIFFCCSGKSLNFVLSPGQY